MVSPLPGYPTHLFIQRRIADAGKPAPGRLGEVSRMMLDYPHLAAMGSVGPDLTFFLDLMPVAQMWLERAIRAYNAIQDFVGPYVAAVKLVETRRTPRHRRPPGMRPSRPHSRTSGPPSIPSGDAPYGAGCLRVRLHRRVRLPEAPDAAWEPGGGLVLVRHAALPSHQPLRPEPAAGGGGRPQAAGVRGRLCTHVAADVVGHSYVNSCAGAPYRTQWQRHHCSDNYLDVWTLAHYEGIDVNESHWSGKYPAEMEPGIRKQFVQGAEGDVCRRSPSGRQAVGGTGVPTDGDISRMWEMLLLAMKRQTDGYSVPAPTPPDFPLDFDTFPSPPSYTETPDGGRRRSGFSWKALFEALIDFVKKTSNYVLDVVKWIVDTAVGIGLYPVRYGCT